MIKYWYTFVFVVMWIVTSKRFYRMIPPREFLQHISHAWKSLSRFMKNASKTDTTEFIMEELQPPTKDLGSLNPLIHEKLNQCPTLKVCRTTLFSAFTFLLCLYLLSHSFIHSFKISCELISWIL
jgi:hypothetical protein